MIKFRFLAPLYTAMNAQAFVELMEF